VARGDARNIGTLNLGSHSTVPLDPRLRRFLDVLAVGNPRDARSVSVAERRTQLIELLQFAGGPSAPIAGAEERPVPGPAGRLAARLYTPPEASGALLPGLVYFHGGGMVAGSINTHDSIARALCYWSSCRVVSIDYRLAPEHPFPAALEDAAAAVTYLAERAPEFGIDAARLGVCGDSAGGTLAAATCQRFARVGKPSLALQLLICPILDYGRTSGSRRDFASGYLIDEATLEHDLMHYAPGGADPADPRISPLRTADMSGLPKTIIHTAEFDPLRDEGQDYFARLTHCGSALAYTCHPGMIHLFYGLGGIIPYARTALEQIGKEVRAALA
jgi:acetyl esterase